MKFTTLFFGMFLMLSTVASVSADEPKSRPDSHAPIGVMGDHGHKSREIMVAYRFMAMQMEGLQSGTESVAAADVLHDFMAVPTQMAMRMHMLGAMFAPHDRGTLMVMANYLQKHMDMEGAHHSMSMAEAHHSTGGAHAPAARHHEMSSAGLGDTKVEAILSLWKWHHLTLIGNAGVSLPTGSIAQMGENRQILPYPMQLGSGSFELRPGVTLAGYLGSWSYGSQLRGRFPLNTNARNYQYGNAYTATVWGARRLSEWLSLGARLRFAQWDTLTGSDADLNPMMSPNHRSDWRGGRHLTLAISGNLLVPTGALAGHRLAIEFQRPMYQDFTGTQLKTPWQLMFGWQYAFRL